MVEFEQGKVKDQLGRPEDKNFIVKRYNYNIVTEANTLVVQKNSLGNSWIVGSSTNGLVGTNTGTQGGGQQVVGGSGRNLVLQVVTNPNKIYREHLRDDYFKDAGGTTAYWDTTGFRIAMSSSNNHARVYNSVATSNEVAFNDGTIRFATITCVERKWNPDDVIRYFLSANGGTNWEEVSLGVEHLFLNTGTDLRFKIVFIGNGGSDTYVDEVRIEYS